MLAIGELTDDDLPTYLHTHTHERELADGETDRQTDDLAEPLYLQ